MQSLSEFLTKVNQELKNTNLFRNIEDKVITASEISFSGNDYLGLANERYAINAGHRDGFGSTGSRLTTGTHQIHLDLENLIARWKKTEAAILFSSGYMANLGAISVLLDSRDIVFVDEVAHACIYDGIRLSKTRKCIFRHNDYKHLEELLVKSRCEGAKALIITDSVFSMDGDRAPLVEISALANKYNASLYVDEAHGAGVLGARGAGLVEELMDEGLLKVGDVEVQMGTFSKAIGLEGAYIAGSAELITYLRNKARTFIYSTAAAPIVIAEAYERITRLYDGELAGRRDKLGDNIEYFRQAINAKGFTIYKSASPIASEDTKPKVYNDMTAIFAVFVGDTDRTMSVAAKLRKAGIFVTPIRPPTVKQARLRISMSSRHNHEQIDKLISSLRA